jgi:predicted PurR-regulated permease PerM
LASALALAWYARSVLFLIFAGVLFAVFLQTLTSWFSSWSQLSYRWSLFVTVILLTTAVGVAVLLFGTRIADQAVRLSQTLPESLERLRAQMEQSDRGKLWTQQFTKVGEWLTSGSALSQLTSGALTVVDGLIGLLVIVFIGLYGAVNPETYLRGAIQLVPPHHRHRAASIFQALAHNLRHWMLGHLVTMFIVGLFAAIGLSILNIPEALVLGLLAFCAELVPYIGPVIASLPAILLGWSQSPLSAIYVAALFLGIHIVEGYMIYPWIMRQAVRLPPALTICGVVVFGFFGGLLGAILATPLTLVGMILVKKLYVEAFLENSAAAL